MPPCEALIEESGFDIRPALRETLAGWIACGERLCDPSGSKTSIAGGRNCLVTTVGYRNERKQLALAASSEGAAMGGDDGFLTVQPPPLGKMLVMIRTAVRLDEVAQRQDPWQSLTETAAFHPFRITSGNP